MGSTFEFTPAMRMAIAALLALCVAGLAWRGWAIYQADQRALKAAAFLAELESTDGEPAGAAPAAPPAAESQTSPPAEARTLIVHVEGAVQRPGVYTLSAGARVNDAITAAGGALPDAVPGVLNLAAPLTDGAKVYVYNREELQPAEPVPPASQGATYQPVTATLSAPAGTAGAGLVNINTAGQAELEGVPGIGPATARAIIDYRTEHGPFRQVDDLINVPGIGPKTLEKLRPYLQV